jgi:hypothetical protein
MHRIMQTASATFRSNFSARRRRMQVVTKVIRTASPTSPTTVNTPATSPLFEKNLDGQGGSKLVRVVVYVELFLCNSRIG